MVPRASVASQRGAGTRRLLCLGLAASPFALALACGGTTSSGTGIDKNNDKLADGLGQWVDANHDGKADTIDINHDGIPDGPAVDTNGDGVADGLALDTDCDGIYDAIDTTGDGIADLVTNLYVPKTAGCMSNTVSGHGASGGAPGAGGAGGAPVSSGGAHSAGAPSTMGGATGSAGSSTGSQLGKAQYQGSGTTTDQYWEADVARNGVGYKFIANGWGKNWQSHSLSWNGTSFKVLSLNGTQGSDYSPAGYPTMFCGLYSKKQSDACGLPATISALKSVKTGWRWEANGNTGQYNAAWDIWLSTDGTNISSYLMVWLRDPPGQQPAGAAALSNATVTGLPGTWTIWKGMVNNLPIVNYVQPEGKDLSELEFDVLDVQKDAIQRGYNLPGSKILAVAVGYETWNGPITNVVTDDFYVDVK